MTEERTTVGKEMALKQQGLHDRSRELIRRQSLPQYWPFEYGAPDRPTQFEYAVIKVDSSLSNTGACIVTIQPAGVNTGKGVSESHSLEEVEGRVLDVFLAAFAQSCNVCFSVVHHQGDPKGWLVRRYAWAEFGGGEKCQACVEDVMARLADIHGIPPEEMAD